MSKVKVPRKSTWVDMTAMTDVAFLLLTFFMLATQFKPDEPVLVDTPFSTSEIKLPESKIIQITIDKKGRIFFGLEGQEYRKAMLKEMGDKKGISFNSGDMEKFSMISSFGGPFGDLKNYLALDSDRRKLYNDSTVGIPCDSTNNELTDWLLSARRATNTGKAAVIAIKGDRDANYPVVKQIIGTLQNQKANRFNFITGLEKGED